MSAEAQNLTPALLDDYAERLRALGAPAVERLAPGLSDAEMDATTARLDLRLPPEARVWWAWRNGILPGGATTPAERRITASANECLSLSEAVLESERTQRIAEQTERPLGRLWWPSLLPLLSTPHGSLIAIDCAMPHETASTVYYLEWEGGILPKAQSLGEMVGWWIEAVESGAYGFDQAQARWIFDWDRLTADQRASQLV